MKKIAQAKRKTQKKPNSKSSAIQFQLLALTARQLAVESIQTQHFCASIEFLTQDSFFTMADGLRSKTALENTISDKYEELSSQML